MGQAVLALPDLFTTPNIAIKKVYYHTYIASSFVLLHNNEQNLLHTTVRMKQVRVDVQITYLCCEYLECQEHRLRIIFLLMLFHSTIDLC